MDRNSAAYTTWYAASGTILSACLMLSATNGMCARQEPASPQAPPIHVGHNHAINPALLEAWQAYRNGNFELAAQRYAGILREDMQNHTQSSRDVLLGMAAIAQQRSQYLAATRYYGQVLTLDPRDPDAHAGLFSLYGAAAGTYTESYLKQLLEQHPEAPALLFSMGNFYAERSRWGDARQAYASACELEPGNARFAFNLAVTLDHLGQRGLAAQQYSQALQLDSAQNAGFDHAQTRKRMVDLSKHRKE